MSSDPTPNKGYGIDYGTYYGTGEPVPPVWGVELVGPDGRQQRLVEAVLSVGIQPEHTALWDASIELAPVIDTAAYRFGEARIEYQGSPEITIEIESIEQADDGTATITGRGKPGMSLVENEIEVSYGGIWTVTAIRDFWRDETEFDATVHNPPTDFVEGITTTTATTPTGFDNILQTRTRDEQGRYLEEEGGTAPDFLPTDPLQITANGVELRQSNWVYGAGVWREPPIEAVPDPNAVDGLAARLTQEGESIEFTINTGYDIPEFAVSPRWKSIGAGGQTPSLVGIDVDGTTLNTENGVAVPEGAYQWHHPSRFRKEEPLSAGEHTITVTKLGGQDDLYIDLVSMHDARFNYTWDNALEANKQLTGPELYPDSYSFTLDAIEPGIDVSDVHITAEFSSVMAETDVGVFVDGTLQQTPQGSRRDTYSFNAPGTVPHIVPIFELSRGGTAPDKTPSTGIESQALEELTIDVDGIAVSVIHASNQTFSGSELEILQSLHEQAGYHFAIKHGWSGNRFVSESFRRGDPALARDIPADAVVTGSSTSSGTGGYRNRVTVVGDEYPPGIRRDDDPLRFEATVEDEDEIARAGVQSITIHDDSLNTEGAVLSRARDELRQRLGEDKHGGSLDTSPAIVEPGYPYRVPRILGQMDVAEAPALGDVPAGTVRTVGSGELFAIRDTATVDGELQINSNGRVVITSTGEMVVTDGALVTVADDGVLHARDINDEIVTCASWSMSESAGSASASGDFGRRGGFGGGDEAGLLGLLAGAAD